MTAPLRVGAALALCAALAACTTTPAAPEDAGPTVYATRVFRFPSDLAIEEGNVPVAGTYLWKWDALTEEAARTGIVTAYWQVLGETWATWQAFPYIHYDQETGTLATTNFAYGPGTLILHSSEPILPGIMEPAFAQIDLSFRVTIYVP